MLSIKHCIALDTVFKNTIVNSGGLKVPKFKNFDSDLLCPLTLSLPLAAKYDLSDLNILHNGCNKYIRDLFLY
jgi:hypothetical protein